MTIMEIGDVYNPLHETNLEALEAMGFPRKRAHLALRHHDNLHQAKCYLNNNSQDLDSLEERLLFLERHVTSISIENDNLKQLLKKKWFNWK